MSAEAVVVVTVVIAMFTTFVVVVGGVWIWDNLPERPARRSKAQVPAAAHPALR